MPSILRPHPHVERLITVGRLILAVFAVIAVRVDPEIADQRLLAVAIGFACYAALLALVVWWHPHVSPRSTIALHVIDFLVFSIFVDLTHAAVSPFFVAFQFSLFCAVLRFGFRGTLLTGIAAILTYVTLATLDDAIRSDPAYLLMRVAAVSVVTLLLLYISAYHERVRGELAKLASWPHDASGDRESALRETLSLACDVLRVPGVRLVWSDDEEPWTYVAEWEAGALTVRTDPPQVEDRQSCLSAPVGQAGLPVLHSDFSGHAVSGRLSFEHLDSNDRMLADVVARLVAARLDHATAAARMRSTAVSEERVRVARDLHDGLLQSLTGATLQLEMIHRLVGRDDETARNRLREVQEIIAADQRELRALITQLRPQSPVRREPPLRERLAALASRVERQWGLGVAIELLPESPEIDDALAAEIYSIVNEGVANAAKHAGATRIDVAVALTGTDAAITIHDDGAGFPFHGKYDLATLNADRRGPVTLKERVTSLGGSLVLDSSPHGSRLEIRIA